MKYEIVKRDRRGETTTIDEGSCDTREEAMETFIDCIIDHGKDDYWMMQDYSRIKAGRNNIYGHPHRQTLDRLEERGIAVYRTDLNGTVGIDIRRNRLKVDVMHPSG